MSVSFLFLFKWHVSHRNPNIYGTSEKKGDLSVIRHLFIFLEERLLRMSRDYVELPLVVCEALLETTCDLS